jgi:hypothetical protein
MQHDALTVRRQTWSPYGPGGKDNGVTVRLRPTHTSDIRSSGTGALGT